MKRMRVTGIVVLALTALAGCGSAARGARESDETTETWTTGDDAALGIGPAEEVALEDRAPEEPSADE